MCSSFDWRLIKYRSSQFVQFVQFVTKPGYTNPNGNYWLEKQTKLIFKQIRADQIHRTVDPDILHQLLSVKSILLYYCQSHKFFEKASRYSNSREKDLVQTKILGCSKNI